MTPWRHLTPCIGNESVPIQLAQRRFPGSNAKMLINFSNKIHGSNFVKPNNTRKLLWFEISKMLIAV